MYEIKKFQFKKNVSEEVRAYRFGENWPVVYILENGKEAYIGETLSAFHRTEQHRKRPERLILSNLYIIADDEYNKSATLDIESSLIRYMSGDGKLLLQNANHGIQESNYYDKERYQAKFQTIWEDLQDLHIANKSLQQIENSDLFKYSPYKALSKDQLQVAEDVIDSIKAGINKPHLVSGEPGTGKTIVATYLMKLLTSQNWSKDLKIGLVVPMTSLRSTLRKVFRSVKGLKSSMILGPNDVVKDEYDILIVDEAHRLQRRVNITNYRDFDRINKSLGFKKDSGNQLDWIIKSSKYQLLFYDPYQSIKPADIRPKEFKKYTYIPHILTSQMRVKGGDDYIKYISEIFNATQNKYITFDNYDLKLFNNIHELVSAIKDKDQSLGLSRLLAGYAWEWKTKNKKTVDYDIEIDGISLKWNSTTTDWVNSEKAVNEVGCIHTIQGYDLNYAGVIIGPEISYDEVRKTIVVDKDKYLDFNGRRGITDPRELDNYIKNIYKTLLTRGIQGTYIYVVDKKLRAYMKNYITTI